MLLAALSLLQDSAPSPSAAIAPAPVPWVEIDAPTFGEKLTIGDVSLCEGPEGTLVVAWTRSTKRTPAGVGIARSTDGGRTWEQIAELEGLSGTTLVAQADHLWLLGVQGLGGQGALVVLRSDDGGRGWSWPLDERSGLLRGQGQYRSLSNAVQVHGKRIYGLFGHPTPSLVHDWRGASERTHVFVASAALDANWLEAANWHFSGEIPLDGIDASFDSGDVVLLQPVPSRLVLCVRGKDKRGELRRALAVGDAGHMLVESAEDREWRLPDGCSGLVDVVDPRTWRHVALDSELEPGPPPPRYPEGQHCLSLYSSQNEKHWQRRTALLRDGHDNHYRFSRASWLLQGDDLAAAILLEQMIVQDKAFEWDPGLVFLRVPGFRERTLETPPLLDVQERWYR